MFLSDGIATSINKQVIIIIIIIIIHNYIVFKFVLTLNEEILSTITL
jgi:hypothetical protein